MNVAATNGLIYDRINRASARSAVADRIIRIIILFILLILSKKEL
jgi:hypothetical protein